MGRYTKKPVTVTAWRIGHSEVMPEVMRDGLDRGMIIMTGFGAVGVTTLEGEMRGNVGDWLIQGVRGEFYPCKDDVFRATYEEAKE